MGMIKIEFSGSFEKDSFVTCAEEGGHVAAIRRGIWFLTARLNEAVKKDAVLVERAQEPRDAPLGEDA